MLRITLAVLFLFWAGAADAQQFTMTGLEVSYPSSLTLVRGALLSDTHLTLTNFQGQWEHGGFIPVNGMEINIFRAEKEGKTLEEIIAENGTDSKMLSRQPYPVGGQSGIRIVWEDDYQLFKITTVKVYVDRGTTYMVRRGDTVWGLNPANWQKIEAANSFLAARRFSLPDGRPGLLIRPGESLTIPPGVSIGLRQTSPPAIYQFILNWDENSSNQKSFEAVFDQILATARFTQ